MFASFLEQTRTSDNVVVRLFRSALTAECHRKKTYIVYVRVRAERVRVRNVTACFYGVADQLIPSRPVVAAAPVVNNDEDEEEIVRARDMTWCCLFFFWL